MAHGAGDDRGDLRPADRKAAARGDGPARYRLRQPVGTGWPRLSLVPGDRPQTGTVLAFDFGTRRIGVAVGDFETGLAHPLTTVAAADNRARFAEIERL